MKKTLIWILFGILFIFLILLFILLFFILLFFILLFFTPLFFILFRVFFWTSFSSSPAWIEEFSSLLLSLSASKEYASIIIFSTFWSRYLYSSSSSSLSSLFSLFSWLCWILLTFSLLYSPKLLTQNSGDVVQYFLPPNQYYQSSLDLLQIRSARFVTELAWLVCQLHIKYPEVSKVEHVVQYLHNVQHGISQKTVYQHWMRSYSLQLWDFHTCTKWSSLLTMPLKMASCPASVASAPPRLCPVKINRESGYYEIAFCKESRNCDLRSPV